MIRRRGMLCAVLVCAVLVWVSGCTSGNDAVLDGSSSVDSSEVDSSEVDSSEVDSSDVDSSDVTSSGVDGSVPGTRAVTPDQQAVLDLVSAINATAGGPVADQNALLLDSTHPDYRAQQEECAPATITIGLDPVIDELRAAPGWTPDPSPTATAGEPRAIPTGVLYRMPTLVLVYTDTRRTGTDLTSLRLSVLDGRAYLFPLCLN